MVVIQHRMIVKVGPLCQLIEDCCVYTYWLIFELLKCTVVSRCLNSMDAMIASIEIARLLAQRFTVQDARLQRS